MPPLQSPGVVTVAPAKIHLDIHDQVQKFLKTEIKDGQTVAMLQVQTDRGANLVIAHKEKVTDGFFEGDWVVESWIGKSGWDKPLEGGIQVVWST